LKQQTVLNAAANAQNEVVRVAGRQKSVDRQTEYDESLAAIRAAGDNLVDLITRGLSTQLESIK
jgi:hypothetical protein